MKKASVVIVTQNNEKSIARLLEALAYQDFKDFEVIIVDLCSTDKTLINAKPYPVKVFRLESGKQSVTRALNLASRVCLAEDIFCVKGNNIPRYANFISSGLKILSRPKTVLCFGPKFRENEAPIVKLIDLGSWGELDDNDRLIQAQEIKDIYLDSCAYKKCFWQQYSFPEIDETSIWGWSSKFMNEDYKIYFNPLMAVMAHEKTGLINYFREKRKKQRLYSLYKEKEKNGIPD
jgi:glycosyltransferase involved in cell wall biosynthesis